MKTSFDDHPLWKLLKDGQFGKGEICSHILIDVKRITADSANAFLSVVLPKEKMYHIHSGSLLLPLTLSPPPNPIPFRSFLSSKE